MYIVFLGVIPMLALMAILFYYCRQNGVKSIFKRPIHVYVISALTSRSGVVAQERVFKFNKSNATKIVPTSLKSSTDSSKRLKKLEITHAQLVSCTNKSLVSSSLSIAPGKNAT